MQISRRASVLRRGFIAAAATWAAALPASVYAGTRPRPSAAVALLAGSVYAAGSIVCHQLPDRSFHLWGAQLPVCARCTGIYVGAAFASLLSSGFSRTFGDMTNTTYAARAALVVAALPTLATLVYEWTTGVTPSNIIRALAGFPLGAAVAAIVLTAADNQVN